MEEKKKKKGFFEKILDKFDKNIEEKSFAHWEAQEQKLLKNDQGPFIKSKKKCCCEGKCK